MTDEINIYGGMREAMKKYWYTLLVILILLLFTACTKETELKMYDTGMKMTTDNFSDTETHTVTLTADSTISFKIVTKSGNLNISVVDESGITIASGVGVTGDMSFRIREKGEYAITISGNSHRGSFTVSW